MGEIGIMMTGLNNGELNLEDLIDEEIRSAGFADLFETSTRDLFRRTEVIESNHASLKSLLDSIDVQLKEYNNLLSVVEVENASSANVEKSPKKDSEDRTVIIIDDDEEPKQCDEEEKNKNDDKNGSNEEKADEGNTFVTYTVSDFSCQTSFDEDSHVTSKQLANISNTTASRKSAAVMSPKLTLDSHPQTETPSNVTNRMSFGSSKFSPTVKDSNRNFSGLSLKMPSSTSSAGIAGDAASGSAVDANREETSPALGFRVLKSPTDGISSPVYNKVALPPSKPSEIPHQRMHGVQSTGPVMSRYRLIAPAPDVSCGSEVRSLEVMVGNLSPPPPVTEQSQSLGKVSSSPLPIPSKPTDGSTVMMSSTSTAPCEEVLSSDRSIVPSASAPSKQAPSFEEGTQVIAKRHDELWYPGVILKVVQDKLNQTKYKVKYNKGMRSLVSINHIAPETSPDPAMLQVGSRVVALRPRDTTEENASWRQNPTGVYGKLDVLYAGIVAEIACPENKNRFLVFFDDGFAQYLSVKKLHYVRHTGKNVWEDVAQHSREFIQEYLEEYPERPMVQLKTGQWVKTEWRGKWLKAKVMQLDCSLVKMLFQVDNRSEWIYRGSTRIEPLYLELAGRHAKKSRKRARKMMGRLSKMSEPYVDYSITKPCFGVSLYSKTDPKGEQQMQQELRQLQNSGQQGQDVGNKSSTSTSSVASSSSVTSSPLNPVPVDVPSSSSTQANIGAGSTRDVVVGDGNKPKSVTKQSSTSTKPVPQETSTDAAQNADVPGTSVSGINPSLNGPVSVTHPSPTGNGPPGTVSESTKSIIEMSTLRKRTNAGLVPKEAHSTRNEHVEVIDLEDTTSSDTVLPTQSNKLTKQEWEAPWLRSDRRDARCAVDNKAPIVKVTHQEDTRKKQDVASRIEARLKTQLPDHKQKQNFPRKTSLISIKSTIRGPHKCSQSCCCEQTLDKKERAKHSPLAVPLILGWQREMVCRHPGNKKEVYYRSPCGRRLRSYGEVAQYLSITMATSVSIDQFCFDAAVSCKDGLSDDKDCIIDDYSRGSEPIPVAVVNSVDHDFPPSIEYISCRIWAPGVNVILDPGFLACCDCTDNCQDKKKCACIQLTIAASAATGGREDENCGYDYRRLMDSVPTGIYECNQNCGCKKSQCFNRVVQNGLQQRVQVFKTEKKGWGLRSVDDIPAGAFVCTYGGQILNEDMADKEGRDFGDEYLAELDHIEVVEKDKEGYESSVSDLEEDDTVIYNTLNPATNSSTTGSYSDYSNSSDESSDMSISSDESLSSGKNSISGNFDETIRLRKRKRTTKRPAKKRSLLDEESLVADRESKAHALSNIADEKWCNLALKRNNDEQQTAAFHLQHLVQEHKNEQSVTETSCRAADCAVEGALGDVNDTVQAQALKGPVEDDGETQSGEFDFDDVSDSFYSSMGQNVIQKESNLVVEPDSTTPEAEVKVDTLRPSVGDPLKKSKIKKSGEELMIADNAAILEVGEEKISSNNTCLVSVESEKVDDSSMKGIHPVSISQTKVVAKGKLDVAFESQQNVLSRDHQKGIDSIRSPSVTESISVETPTLSPGLSTKEEAKNPGNEVLVETTNRKATDSATRTYVSSADRSNSKTQIPFKKAGAEEIGNVATKTSDHSGSCVEELENSSLSSTHEQEAIAAPQKSEKTAPVLKDELLKQENLVKAGVNTQRLKVGDKLEKTEVNTEVEQKMSAASDSNQIQNLEMKQTDKGESNTHVEPTASLDSSSKTGYLLETAKNSETEGIQKKVELLSTSHGDSRDSVPPLLSAEDLSKIAATRKQTIDEEPPKLTKMAPAKRGVSNINLAEMISKLKTRVQHSEITEKDSDSSVSKQSDDSDRVLQDFDLSSPESELSVSPASLSDTSRAEVPSRAASEMEFDGEKNQKKPRKGNKVKSKQKPKSSLMPPAARPSLGQTLSRQSSVSTGSKRVSTRKLFDEEHCYVIDAKAYGNCGRFLNHSCSPNLFVQNVFVDTHDLRFPWVAFFAQQNISAGEELTWDYMYEIGSVPDKRLDCFCGSEKCPGRFL